MRIVLLILLYLKIITSFNNELTRIIGKSLVASTLLYEPIEVPINKEQTIKYHNEENINYVKTTLGVERNNIYLYGGVSDESCNELKNKLNELEFNGNLFRLVYKTDPPPINLHIKSYGGSLMDTLYIVDLIESLNTPVNTYVDGYSASAASLISVVGDNRYMTENSMILIHQLYTGNEGKYEELNDSMINAKNLMKKIKKIYLRHTNIQEDDLNEILKHDLWLDAETCLRYGLVDKII